MPRRADWVFDFISPYADLQFEGFGRRHDHRGDTAFVWTIRRHFVWISMLMDFTLRRS